MKITVYYTFSFQGLHIKKISICTIRSLRNVVSSITHETINNYIKASSTSVFINIFLFVKLGYRQSSRM